ncbi:MAG: hypothetical protein R2795_02935 [Saprospiraceae bacterium]
MGRILPAFSIREPVDTNAIADLAIDNFYEMQDKVTDPDFIKKRKLEMELEAMSRLLLKSIHW